MAFQIDPNIPLQAGKVQFDPASILMQAQQNAANLEKHRFEMQKLREDYDAQKEARKQQKAMQMGIASDLGRIQSGTPAQYSQPSYAQTMPTGQMSQGMTGVLASERGQQMPQPQLFGENILQGNVDFNREMVSPAVAGREPSYIEMLQIGLKNAMAVNDGVKVMEYAKALQEIKNKDTEYFGGLTSAIDESTQKPIYLANTKSGVVPVVGYSPPLKEVAQKVTPVLVNGVPKTLKVPGTNEVKILMSDGTLSSGGSIPTPPAPEKPISGYQKIKLEGDLRDDYRKDSSNFVEISRQARIIQDSLNDDSAAATLASATAFMKMLDPGSVVRESELAMAMKTNGALDRMGNYINVIQSGRVLTKQQKADFAKLIKSYSNASNEAQRNLNKKYGQIASEYGLDPKRVVVYDVQKDDKPEKVDAKITPQTKIVKTRADLDKVKSGESYIAPDGKLWVKP